MKAFFEPLLISNKCVGINFSFEICRPELAIVIESVRNKAQAAVASGVDVAIFE